MKLKGIALFVCLLLAAIAGAESFDYHCANIAILQDRSVQNAVGVTDAQRLKMNKFADAHRLKLEAYNNQLKTQMAKTGKPAQPDMKLIQSYLEQLKANVVGVLTPAQVKRVRELNLQAAGLIGLLDKVVATKVGMNDAQFKSYAKLYSDGKNRAAALIQGAVIPINKKYEGLMRPYKGQEKQHAADIDRLKKAYDSEMQAAQRKVDPQVKAIERDTQAKLNGALTSTQRATWVALQGKKFVPPTK